MEHAVRPLGDPQLRQKCRAVVAYEEGAVIGAKLKNALAAARAAHGFGRAIAAPQIGIEERVLYVAPLDLVLLNPEIVAKSYDTISLWDDCLSAPDLLVRVERDRSVSVAYTDVTGRPQLLQRLPEDMSELLQHEIDHLNGVLLIDRAIDKRSIITRAAYQANSAYFAGLVDRKSEAVGGAA
jgi:peptide deformylase